MTQSRKIFFSERKLDKHKTEVFLKESGKYLLNIAGVKKDLQVFDQSL